MKLGGAGGGPAPFRCGHSEPLCGPFPPPAGISRSCRSGAASPISIPTSSGTPSPASPLPTGPTSPASRRLWVTATRRLHSACIPTPTRKVSGTPPKSSGRQSKKPGRVDLLGSVFLVGVGFCVGFSILVAFGALTKNYKKYERQKKYRSKPKFQAV